MLGATRGVTQSLVGWLWADILLGLFVIFLAASSAPAQEVSAQAAPPGIDPKPFETTIAVNPEALLGTSAPAIATEQQRIAAELTAQLTSAQPGRKAAMILAYGNNEDPVNGDKLTKVATETLPSASFASATMVVKTFHNLVPGDPGTKVAFQVYLYQ